METFIFDLYFFLSMQKYNYLFKHLYINKILNFMF